MYLQKALSMPGEKKKKEALLMHARGEEILKKIISRFLMGKTKRKSN